MTGKPFRIVSYAALLGALVFSVVGAMAPGHCGQGMACVGVGLGNALWWLLTSAAAFLIAPLINLVGFLMAPSPRSLGRKIELAVFWMPLALMGLGLLLVLNR